jgi:hypothetical protein
MKEIDLSWIEIVIRQFVLILNTQNNDHFLKSLEDQLPVKMKLQMNPEANVTITPLNMYHSGEMENIATNNGELSAGNEAALLREVRHR